MRRSASMQRRKRTTRRSMARNALTLYYSGEMSMELQNVAVRPRLPWLKALDALFLLALVGLLGFFFADVSFYVRQVRVAGNHLVSESEIRDAVGLRSWSIFYVNRCKIAEALRDRFPCIRSLNITCRLPSYVAINIQERQPEAVWKTSGGAYLVDAEGVILLTASSERDWIVITDNERRAVSPGDVVDAKAVHTAKELAQLLPQAKAFIYTRENGIVWIGPHGWEVRFGLGGDLPTKVANLQALIKDIEAHRWPGVEYIDVRLEGRPLYRPIGSRS